VASTQQTARRSSDDAMFAQGPLASQHGCRPSRAGVPGNNPGLADPGRRSSIASQCTCRGPGLGWASAVGPRPCEAREAHVSRQRSFARHRPVLARLRVLVVLADGSCTAAEWFQAPFARLARQAVLTPLPPRIRSRSGQTRLTWGFIGWQVLGSNQRRLSRRFYRARPPDWRNAPYLRVSKAFGHR
jgi:hypothetical protein